MKRFWRVASVVVVFLMALVLDPFEINWGAIELGTAPEWISALSLIAAAAWRIAVPGNRENRPTRLERVRR